MTRVGSAFVVIVGLLMTAALGAMSTLDARLAVVGALVLVAAGVSAWRMSVLPLLAFPGVLLILRVGGGEQSGISLSDLLLAAAVVPALLLIRPRECRALQALLWLTGVYQLVTLTTVIWNPYLANTVEWFHAALLTAGALVVGFAVGREGFARQALALYVGFCTLIGGCAVLTALARAATGDFAAVYLPFMHKNFIGCMLGFAAVVAYTRPDWLRWRPSWAHAAFAICVLGVLVAQSRQGLIGLIVGVLFVAVRSQRGGQVALGLVAMTPIAFLVFDRTRDQLASGDQFNSLYQRLTWYEQALQVWDTSPWLGVGLRWWYTDRFPYAFQPPNALVEVLTSTGMLGVAAFLVLFGGGVLVLLRVDPAYGTLAAAMLLTRFVQGQFDLFWVAAQVSAPFLIAGVCLGAMTRDQVQAQPHAGERVEGVPAPPVVGVGSDPRDSGTR